MTNMCSKLGTAFFILMIVFASDLAAGQADWGQFRGPGGLGVAPKAKNLPVEFGPTSSLVWSCELPPGHSSPVIAGNRIFLTGYANKTLETFCVDSSKGKILWRKAVPAEKIERIHPISSPAAPTPATDGRRVFVYFGSYGLVCYDLDGTEIWQRPMPLPKNMYGTAASPVVAGDVLIFIDDQADNSCLWALDPKTGEPIWKKDRSSFTAGWSTPMVWRNNGVEEVVIYGNWWLVAYDLKSGEERWSFGGLTDEPCITPVSGEGLVFITSYNMGKNPEVIGPPAFDDIIRAYDQNEDGQIDFDEVPPDLSLLSRNDVGREGTHPLRGYFNFLDIDRDKKVTREEYRKWDTFLQDFKFENGIMGIRPGGQDGMQETKAVWTHNTGVPEAPSPLYYQEHVYTVMNGGTVTCQEAASGERKYISKLGAGGAYYASLVAGEGKIFASSMAGVVTVFEAGEELKVLARNDLQERIMATPAIVGERIYVRTDNHLYAFGLR
jgi:outer membrane protein assembly factor BamB